MTEYIVIDPLDIYVGQEVYYKSISDMDYSKCTVLHTTFTTADNNVAIVLYTESYQGRDFDYLFIVSPTEIYLKKVSKLWLNVYYRTDLPDLLNFTVLAFSTKGESLFYKTDTCILSTCVELENKNGN